MPDDPNKPYDMRKVVARIVDDGEFFEVHEHCAKNIVCGFSRLDGHPVGVVGNQPAFKAGVLDIESSEKAARFVRTCDAFNIPILTFTDVPGFMPGTDQEWNGIIRRGAKLLYAYTEATVPKLTVVTRKAYGGAYDVMASKHMLADYNIAWPTAEVAVMGPEGAVNIIYRKDIASSPTPEERRAKLIADYKAHFANPYSAAERGYIDDVIEPRQTRPKLIKALRTLQTQARRPAEAQARQHPALDDGPDLDLRPRYTGRGGCGQRCDRALPRRHRHRPAAGGRRHEPLAASRAGRRREREGLLRAGRPDRPFLNRTDPRDRRRSVNRAIWPCLARPAAMPRPSAPFCSAGGRMGRRPAVRQPRRRAWQS